MKVKSILKKVIINSKFIINYFLRKHKCLLCHDSNLYTIFTWPWYYLKCDRCDMIFVGNPPSSYSYQLLIQKLHSFGEYRNRPDIDWQKWQGWKLETYRNLDFFYFEKILPESKRVLEIGCAEGKQLEIFKSRGWDTLGIEPNRYLAKECKRLGINTIEGYIEKIKFPERSFDLVIATHVLEHLRNPCIVVKKISQLLKDDGRIILEVPLNICYGHPEHLFFFSKRSLTKLLVQNGFIITKEFRYLDKLFNNDNYAVMAKKAPLRNKHFEIIEDVEKK